ncbi:MAG: SPOR domain-containing protein [Thioalkalispiraceae bacterium]
MDENRIKQRIIGAIVLVSLAVIFIPMILSGGREQSMPLFGSPVPSKPDNITDIKVLEFENKPAPPEPRKVIRSPVDEHTRADDLPVEAPVKETQHPQKNSALKTQKAPAVTQDEAAKAWAVQVGSFTQSSNALKLKEQLIKKGYPAFVEQLVMHNKTTYRVRVGPEVRRDDAIQLQKQIEQKMNIKGLVVSHP